MRYKELLIILLVGVIVFLLFQKRPMYTANRLQTIEHIIQGKDSVVTKWKTKIVSDKGKIEGLTSQVNRYKDSLHLAKELKDTVLIIQTQDTIIKQLDLNIRHYNELIRSYDSVYHIQNNLIDLKDSVIMIQRNELNDLHTKKKRKKIATILSGLGLATLFIIK